MTTFLGKKDYHLCKEHILTFKPYKNMKQIFGNLMKDSEAVLILKQLAFGSAMGIGFLAMVYLGGLLAKVISGV